MGTRGQGLLYVVEGKALDIFLNSGSAFCIPGGSVACCVTTKAEL